MTVTIVDFSLGTQDISDNLMVNNDGYLYVNDNFELKINSISWSIPII